MLSDAYEICLYNAVEACKSELKTSFENKNYDQALARLALLKDPVDNFFDNVLVNVEVKGEGRREGDSLTVSFGGESKLYDVTVPRSSVYEDNDGKFVLTLDSKRTPLGERYIVNRHDVEVIAEDE